MGKSLIQRAIAQYTVSKSLEDALKAMELAIAATPTSELRNLLTEINIRLMKAQELHRHQIKE